MMDLLIQVATANKISPGGHVIQVISDRSHSCLSYKPNTPIGTYAERQTPEVLCRLNVVHFTS